MNVTYLYRINVVNQAHVPTVFILSLVYSWKGLIKIFGFCMDTVYLDPGGGIHGEALRAEHGTISG
jgi:hypothetical protein